MLAQTRRPRVDARGRGGGALYRASGDSERWIVAGLLHFDQHLARARMADGEDVLRRVHRAHWNLAAQRREYFIRRARAGPLRDHPANEFRVGYAAGIGAAAIVAGKFGPAIAVHSSAQ